MNRDRDYRVSNTYKKDLKLKGMKVIERTR